MTLTLSTPANKIRPTEDGADSKALSDATEDSTGPGPAGPPLTHTMKGIIDSVTTGYLAALDPDAPPYPWKIEADLIDLTNLEFGLENLGRSGTNKLTLLKALLPGQVAQILATVHRVVRLIPSHHKDAIPNDKDPLVIYRPQSDIYLHSTDAITAAAAQYSNGGVQCQKDMMAALRVHAPHLRHGTSHE